MTKLDELRSLYESLYPAEGFEDLKALLDKYRCERPDDLKKLDEKRQREPYWYRKPGMLGVTMYSELFAGDFKKLEEKLDFLEEEGISYLHLMPVMKMREGENDGGYAVEDFYTVDPRFGSNQDLARLAKRLRERGISLCLDFVMNHSADTHEWAKKAKAGDKFYQAFYFVYCDRTIPDEFEKTVPQVFPTTAPGNFIFCEEMNAWVMSSFYPFQWDLNYRNPNVLLGMLKAMLEMANLGVECFRLDAVPYIWKELNTSCRNLPQVHTLVRIFRLAAELVAPSVIFKGEVVMAPKELRAYFGSEESPECHLLYGVSTMVNLWGALASHDTRLLKTHLEEVFSLPSHCGFVNYLRCHDDIGWGLDEDRERELGIDPLKHKIYLYSFYEGRFKGSFARGQLYNYDYDSLDARSCGTTASLCGLEEAFIEHDREKEEEALKRILSMYATVYMIKGFPMLSSGDEIAQLNDYSYMNDFERAADSRNLHRSPFNWQKAKLRKKEGTVENRIFSALQKLNEIRKNNPCFDERATVTTWDSHNTGVLGLRRTMDDHVLLSVTNFSPEKQTVHFDFFTGLYTDLFTGIVVEPGLEFDVQAYSCLYLYK